MEDSRQARYRATVHYDGAGFHGWQLQPDVRTVQGEVEAALAEITQQTVRVDAAGRTDRGVHATAQEIAFDAPEGWAEEELRRALQAVLPADAGVERLGRAGPDFHPRYDARGRRYEYYVAPGLARPHPLRRRRVWAVAPSPQLPLLHRASARLRGRRSFEAFAKSGQPDRGTVCQVREALWDRTVLGDLRFTIVADRFLHHMVRYLVSVLVEIAVGRREEDEIRALLSGSESARPPAPAPPGGLYLTGVRYGAGWNRGPGVPGLTARRPDGRDAPPDPARRDDPPEDPEHGERAPGRRRVDRRG